MARRKPLIVRLAKRRIEALRIVAFSRAKYPMPATAMVLVSSIEGNKQHEDSYHPWNTLYPRPQGGFSLEDHEHDLPDGDQHRMENRCPPLQLSGGLSL